MNAIKELILDKLEHLETLSGPVLQEVGDQILDIQLIVGARRASPLQGNIDIFGD